MENPPAVPEVDVSRPHMARIYDYFLGGKNHFAADRETAREDPADQPRHPHRRAREPRVPRPRGQVPGGRGGHPAVPRHRDRAADHRQRARGGAGGRARVPCRLRGQRPAGPRARAGAARLPRPKGRTAYIHADLREPRQILADPAIRDVLDFGQPIALVMLAILHLIQDDDKPAEIIATLLDALPSGSYLVASHITMEHAADAIAAGQRTMRGGRPLGPGPQLRRVRAARVPRPRTGAPGCGPRLGVAPGGDGPRPALAEVNCYGGVARKP